MKSAHPPKVLLDSGVMPALYYPFHLCHERTLLRLLDNYEAVHFRDFMALQLTPLMGTTAFPDRMGDYYPELLNRGRVVQGHDVSGSMSSEVIDAVNRDLADGVWRSIFHEALQHDSRFQQGLFDISRLPQAGNTVPKAPSVLFPFSQGNWVDQPYDVNRIRTLSRRAFSPEAEVNFEYGWALIKTAAALVYTIQLTDQLELIAVTDSASHYQLLARTCERDHLTLANSCVSRDSY